MPCHSGQKIESTNMTLNRLLHFHSHWAEIQGPFFASKWQTKKRSAVDIRPWRKETPNECALCSLARTRGRDTKPGRFRCTICRGAVHTVGLPIKAERIPHLIDISTTEPKSIKFPTKNVRARGQRDVTIIILTASERLRIYLSHIFFCLFESLTVFFL